MMIDLLKICKNDVFPVRSVKLRSIKGLRMMHFFYHLHWVIIETVFRGDGSGHGS